MGRAPVGCRGLVSSLGGTESLHLANVPTHLCPETSTYHAGGRVVQACKHVQLAKHVGVHGGERVARACKHVHMADHVGVQAGE
eukprot:scaffold42543_cov22-Tisochrysis_lutea.AAC.3